MYNPAPETAELLNWMLRKIKSVPYGVSLRWAFYQAVQERGQLKSDYANVKKYTSKARKSFWNGWRPDTLIDDTRTIYKAGHGYDTFFDWFKSLKKLRPVYEVFSHQDKIVQIWFEAQAMYSQFDHYASPYRITLVPFKGDTSINHKWKIGAEYLAALYEKYRKPIVVLYFGDYEPFTDRGSRAKGITIPLNALADIIPYFLDMLGNRGILTVEEIRDIINNGRTEEWLKFVRVGLNQEHIDKWHLPENPERPGEYQWEALGDEQAQTLIDDSIQQYWSASVIREIEEKEEVDTEKWQKIFDDAIKRFEAGNEVSGG